jgi:hypothetical protein
MSHKANEDYRLPGDTALSPGRRLVLNVQPSGRLCLISQLGYFSRISFEDPKLGAHRLWGGTTGRNLTRGKVHPPDKIRMAEGILGGPSAG